MPDGEVKILFRTEAELQGSKQLEQSLERQIGAAKAAGKPYTDLEQQHKRVSASISQHEQAAKGMVKADEDVAKSTEKVTDRKKQLQEILRGLSLQFPLLGRVIGAVMNPLGAIGGVVAVAVASFMSLLRAGAQVEADFKVGDTLDEIAAQIMRSSDSADRGLKKWADGLKEIQAAAGGVSERLTAALANLKELQRLELEAKDKKLAAASAKIDERVARREIPLSEGLRQKAALEDSLAEEKAELEKRQAAEQKEEIRRGIAAAEVEKAKAKARLLPEAEVKAKEHQVAIAKAGLTLIEGGDGLQLPYQDEKKRLREALKKERSEVADLEQEAALKAGVPDIFSGRMAGTGYAERAAAKRPGITSLEDDLKNLEAQRTKAEGSVKSAGVDLKGMQDQNKALEGYISEQDKTITALRGELQQMAAQEKISGPIRQEIKGAESSTRATRSWIDINSAVETETKAAEERKREADRLRNEAAEKAEKEDKRKRDEEFRNFNSGGPAPDISAATDGIRSSAENLAQLPQATQALAQATVEAVNALWQAVADIRGRQRDGLS